VAPFSGVAPGIDEVPRDRESALALVTRLSLAKARAVASRHPDAWVIGSDQAAVLLDAFQQQRILGKPGTEARCIEQIRSCSGKTVAYLTGVAVVQGPRAPRSNSSIPPASPSAHSMSPRSSATFARESPLDCAGGFKSEGLGISLCSSIDSDDPSALIGLPLIRLCELLRRVGFHIP